MKLHIGGEAPKEGWKILNIQNKPHVDYIGDISDLSQFKDGEFSEVYASHVFEHVKQKDIQKTLAGISRIIKTGGAFHISVPDMDELCQLYLNKSLTFDQRWHVMRMMFGGQIDVFDFHYAGWNEEFLNAYLINAGFSRIERLNSFGIFKDTSDFTPYGSYISLNLTAFK
jgi:predicted SAM-dependent methyltransferase